MKKLEGDGNYQYFFCETKHLKVLAIILNLCEGEWACDEVRKILKLSALFNAKQDYYVRFSIREGSVQYDLWKCHCNTPFEVSNEKH